LTQSIAKDLKANFYEFFKFYWKYVEPVPLVDNWHIKYLCDVLQEAGERLIRREEKKYDICINVPPGSSKSRIASVLFPLWCWVNKPTMKQICSGYSSKLSIKFSRDSRDILQHEDFQLMFPEVVLRKDQHGVSEYGTEAGGVRWSVGFTGTVTGMHADLIIIDDPLKAESANSKLDIETANRVITDTLSTRKTDSEVSLTILIMQRLHENDATATFLKRNKKVKHICLPGELTDKVNPPELKEFYVDGLLDPKRGNRSVLESRRDILKDRGYASQVLQNPVAESIAIFNPKDWVEYNITPPFDFIVQSWDTAFKEKENNDYSVGTTWGLNIDGFWLIDIFRAKLNPYFLEQEIVNQYEKHNPHLILIEDAASGQSIIPSLENKTNLPIEGIKPMNKIVRANIIQPRHQQGLMHIPAKFEGKLNFLSEHTAFPNGTHDDQVDSTTIAVQYLEAMYETLVKDANYNCQSKRSYDLPKDETVNFV
jgi:predicted phage terminase large subunit-like protein